MKWRWGGKVGWRGWRTGGGRKKQRRALLSIIVRFITAPSGALQLTIHTVHIDLNDNPDRDQCVNGGKLTPNRPLDVAAGSPSPFPLAPPTTLFLPPTAPPLMQKPSRVSKQTTVDSSRPSASGWRSQVGRQREERDRLGGIRVMDRSEWTVGAVGAVGAVGGDGVRPRRWVLGAAVWTGGASVREIG